MSTSYKTRIQNKIRDAIMESEGFLQVQYDTDGYAHTTESVSPRSAYTNETNSSFSEPVLRRQSLQVERDSWTFDALVSFDCEVSAEGFEAEMEASPPVLARDSNHTRQVRLLLRETFPEHPVQQDSESGSRFRFVFEAELSPR